MALHDPINAYTTATNIDAHLVCSLLVDAGIEAVVVEDTSGVGLWVGGTSQLHKPNVMIARADAERARPIIQKYDQQSAARLAAKRASKAAEAIPVTCESCQTTTLFPASQRGTVQYCPKCNAFLDVGDADDVDDENYSIDDAESSGDD